MEKNYQSLTKDMWSIKIPNIGVINVYPKDAGWTFAIYTGVKVAAKKTYSTKEEAAKVAANWLRKWLSDGIEILADEIDN